MMFELLFSFIIFPLFYLLFLFFYDFIQIYQSTAHLSLFSFCFSYFFAHFQFFLILNHQDFRIFHIQSIILLLTINIIRPMNSVLYFFFV
jgi:hypothetical protein